MKTYCMIIASILVFTYCDKSNNPLNNIDSEIEKNYPTTLNALSEVELQLLQEEFDSLNNYQISSRLNKFGLTGESYYNRPNPFISITDEQTAIDVAISTLLKNIKFTNFSDDLYLPGVNLKIHYVSNDSTKWILWFGEQSYQGYRIWYSMIYVYLYGDGVYEILNSWYKDIYIPPIEKVAKDSIKQRLVGERIIWYTTAGHPVEFIITSESVIENYKKLIFPLKKEDSIELRVCWEIEIRSGFLGWDLYLDTITNEILTTIPRFRT